MSASPVSAPVLAPDAAIALGIASTALPFACTPEDAAERWLRILRLHGEAGATLQALGVSEGPLRGAVEPAGDAPVGIEGGDQLEEGDQLEGREALEDRDALAQVLERAALCAGRRHAAGVATSDLLVAVMDVYGAAFERVLRAHGTDRDEVLERLAAADAA